MTSLAQLSLHHPFLTNCPKSNEDANDITIHFMLFTHIPTYFYVFINACCLSRKAVGVALKKKDTLEMIRGLKAVMKTLPMKVLVRYEPIFIKASQYYGFVIVIVKGLLVLQRFSLF